MSVIRSSFFGSPRSHDPFNLDVGDPFPDFHFGGTSFTAPRPFYSNETTSFANAQIDWKETPDAHVFEVDIPGLKKDEVKVDVEECRVLRLSGDRRVEKEEKTDKWHCVERRSGKFLRRFRLPENAKTAGVKACMENGVLTVTVPKDEMKKPHAIAKVIDIK